MPHKTLEEALERLKALHEIAIRPTSNATEAETAQHVYDRERKTIKEEYQVENDVIDIALGIIAAEQRNKALERTIYIAERINEGGADEDLNAFVEEFEHLISAYGFTDQELDQALQSKTDQVNTEIEKELERERVFRAAQAAREAEEKAAREAKAREIHAVQDKLKLLVSFASTVREHCARWQRLDSQRQNSYAAMLSTAHELVNNSAQATSAELGSHLDNLKERARQQRLTDLQNYDSHVLVIEEACKGRLPGKWAYVKSLGVMIANAAGMGIAIPGTILFFGANEAWMLYGGMGWAATNLVSFHASNAFLSLRACSRTLSQALEKYSNLSDSELQQKTHAIMEEKSSKPFEELFSAEHDRILSDWGFAMATPFAGLRSELSTFDNYILKHMGPRHPTASRPSAAQAVPGV